MTFYIFQIPVRTRPKELTELMEKVYCFPSNYIDSSINTKRKPRYICLVIDSEFGSNVTKILKDFIIALNLFAYEWHSIRWFSSFSIETQLTSNETIENIYKQYKVDIDIQVHNNDFNQMSLELIVVKSHKFSLIEVFTKLFNLPKSDFLYNSLSYLSITTAIINFTNKIYNNGLFEGALLFQLFESILNEYDRTPVIIKEKCLTCNHIKERGLNKKIEDFFVSDEFKNINSKKEIISVIKKVARNRHKFFHNLKGKSTIEYFEVLMSNFHEGQTINIDDDIKYAEGAIQAVGVLKAVNTLILLNKLLNRELTNIEILVGVVGK